MKAIKALLKGLVAGTGVAVLLLLALSLLMQDTFTFSDYY